MIIIIIIIIKRPFAWSEEKPHFEVSREGTLQVPKQCVTFAIWLFCKHVPNCGVTGNDTNENKREKSNGVSNFFIEFSVTCDL